MSEEGRVKEMEGHVLVESTHLPETLPAMSSRWGDDGREFVHLVTLMRWMEDWVGAGNVPDETAVGEAMQKLNTMQLQSSESI
jgi:hypothetical protein